MTDQQASPSRPGRTMAALLIPLFASLMSISIVNVALPAIEDGLGASPADLQWVLSGYALAFGVVLVPCGRAGDIWGRRRVFLLGVALFGLAALASALAPDPLFLNVVRVLMGAGAGMLVPQIIGMIQQLFTGAARGRAYGLMSTVIGVGVGAGPAVGGLLIDATDPQIGWRLTFLINVPVVFIALLFAAAWLPRPSKDDVGRSSERPTSGGWVPGKRPEDRSTSDAPVPEDAAPRGLTRLDPFGMVLLAVGVVLLMLPFIQFRSLLGAGLAAAGLVLLVLWVLWEHRLGQRHPAAPMVNLRLFTLPSFTWNSVVLSVYFMGMPAIWAIVAIYVQQGLGYGALVAGIVTLPSAAMMVLLGSQVGQRAPRMGPEMMQAGTVLAVLSMLALAGAAGLMVTDYGSLWWLGVALGINGLSQVLIIPTAQTLSMQDVPEEMAGAAGGVAQTAQRISTAVGIALVTGIYFAVTAAEGHQTGFIVGVLVIAGLMLGAVVAAVFAARRARRA